VLKRGGNDDEGEDGEDDETISIPFQAEAGNANNAAAASSAPATSEAAGPDAPPAPSAGAAVPTAPPAQGLSAAGLAAIDLTGEGPAQGSGEKPEAASIDLSPKEGASDKEDSLGLSDLFEKKPEIDQNLRELAEAQEDVSVQELAQELRAFLAHLEGRPEE
jgi:hypothetical protein